MTQGNWEFTFIRNPVIVRVWAPMQKFFNDFFAELLDLFPIMPPIPHIIISKKFHYNYNLIWIPILFFERILFR